MRGLDCQLYWNICKLLKRYFLYIFENLVSREVQATDSLAEVGVPYNYKINRYIHSTWKDD